MVGRINYGSESELARVIVVGGLSVLPEADDVAFVLGHPATESTMGWSSIVLERKLVGFHTVFRGEVRVMDASDIRVITARTRPDFYACFCTFHLSLSTSFQATGTPRVPLCHSKHH